MLPAGYTSLLVCETGRAEQWKAGLARAGFDVRVERTLGREAEKGEWEVGVADAQAAKARTFVAAVIQGTRRLPRGAALSPAGFRALVAVAVILALLFLVGWLTR